MLPTLAELTDARPPNDVDGISILPELLGAEATGRAQPTHEFLYWEFRSQTAVRMADWKAIQPKKNGPWELYDLSQDVREANNIAARHPNRLARMQQFAAASHEPVKPGKYLDPKRTRHERDRQAKWGSSRTRANK